MAEREVIWPFRWVAPVDKRRQPKFIACSCCGYMHSELQHQAAVTLSIFHHPTCLWNGRADNETNPQEQR